MEMRNTYKHLLIGAVLLIATHGFGQVSVPFNAGGPLDYVGWDASNLFPLDIRHEGDQPIDFYTNNIFRARINNTTTFSLPGFASVPANGFTLISPDASFLTGLAGSPYSRLHLAEGVTGNASPWGFRSWNRNGITFTGNADHGYIGHKYGIADVTDMVIQWSDNPGFLKADRMRFIFTSEYLAGTPSGMNSLEGLEGMRLWPADANNVNVGLGDFFVTPGNPTERLDIANGRVRIRQLPTDITSTSDEMVTVNMVTGILEHKPIPGLCEWTMSTTSPNNLFTAVGASSPTCPDDNEVVSIGTYVTGAKLNVQRLPTATDEVGISVITKTDATAGGSEGKGIYTQCINGTGATAENIHYAMHGQAFNGLGLNYGLLSEGNGGTATGSVNYGVYGIGQGGTNSTGLYGKSISSTSINTGVAAWGYGNSTSTSTYGVNARCSPNTGFNYGLYSYCGPYSATSWAGYFQGNMHVAGLASCTFSVWTSDASLKTNVEEINNAMELIRQLRPTTYDFLTDQNASMNLPSGMQRGFIAQEIEEVLPDVVHELQIAPVLDEAGEVVSDGRSIKGINYVAIIPMLVAGMQEQDLRIAEQEAQLADAQATNAALNDQLQQLTDRLDAMEQNVSDCCAAHGALENGGEEIDEKTLNSTDRYLRIAPNPFETQTTVYYQLEQGGRMQLLANSADGKQLQVLQEAEMEAGNYQYEWATGDLAPGVYYVTLLMDGKPVTKRAVKILR